MRVISRSTLRNFWEVYPNAKSSLLLWYERIISNPFETFVQIRAVFPAADIVGNFYDKENWKNDGWFEDS
jgi:mRNA interferase HigB